jgi:DNA replication protein DnaC
MHHHLTDAPTPMDDRAAPPPHLRPRSWPASSTDCDVIAAGPSPDGVCPDCDGAGYYTLAVPIGHPDFGKLLPCACRVRAREQRAQEQAAQHTQALLAELARTLGRLALARFDTFDLERLLDDLVWGGATFPVDVQRQALAQALDDAQRYAAQPAGWLYLCGPCGAGKSHLAAAIANTVARTGRGVAYASVPDLLRFVRRGFGDGAADERLDALIQIDVLILDDLGAEYLTAWAAEQLFVLLNARYLADRATVLTSNDRPEALPARLQSRIAEQAQLIWMPISDYRQLRAGG